MPHYQLFSLFFLVISSEAIHGPCHFKNVTVMGSFSQRPIATPSNCGLAVVNASELSTRPNVILHSVDESRERNESYTFMLLEEIPQVRDVFRLRWLVSNITPLKKSLTANQTHIEFAKYEKPITDPSKPMKMFLYVYKQNRSQSGRLVGLGADELNMFAPQQWVTRNKDVILDIVGGVEFSVAANATHGAQPNTHGHSVPPFIPTAPQPAHPHPGQYQPPSYQPGQYHPPQYQPGQYPAPNQPAHPGNYQPPPVASNPAAGQPQNPTNTVNNFYYGKVKDDKKKKNSSTHCLPIASLIIALALSVMRA